MESKQDRIIRGVNKALAQQSRRATDTQRHNSRAIDPRATIAVDLRTEIGFATNLAPNKRRGTYSASNSSSHDNSEPSALLTDGADRRMNHGALEYRQTRYLWDNKKDFNMKNFNRARLVCFDNPPSEPVVPAADDTARFSQSDLNKCLAEDRRRHQAQVTKIQQTLEETLTSKNLTAQERDSLQERLDGMKHEFRTKEEQQAHERKQLEDGYKAKLSEESKAKTTWETKFKQALVEQELGRAAAGADAFNPGTVVTILREHHRIEQVKDEKTGQFTGDYRVVIDLPVKTETGVVKMPLDPVAAVAKLRTDQEHANLWKANLVGGIGSNSGAATGANGKIDLKNLTAAQYNAIRSKTPELLGLRREKGASIDRAQGEFSFVDARPHAIPGPASFSKVFHYYRDKNDYERYGFQCQSQRFFLHQDRRSHKRVCGANLFLPRFGAAAGIAPVGGHQARRQRDAGSCRHSARTHGNRRHGGGEKSAERIRGTVTHVVPERMFAFVEPDGGGPRHFIHANECDFPVNSEAIGLRVEFEPVPDPRGLQGVGVQRVEE